MSFVGGAGGVGILGPEDWRACWAFLYGNEDLYQPPPVVDLLLPQDAEISDYRTSWWPARGGFAGDQGIDVGVIAESPVPYEMIAGPPSGCNGRLAFSGVTRDQYGSAVGNVTVKVFRTSDDSLQSMVLSDANGNYLITTPYYPDAHYLVVYKVGSPDIFGTTVNTLVAG